MSNYWNMPVSQLPPGFTGYPIERERRDEIEADSISAGEWFTDWSETVSRPESANALDWVVTENQGRIGSCAGHGATSTAEGCHWLAAGESPQFSPWAQYRLAQDRDGIRGDRGSTIAGNLWVLKNLGLVPREMCPKYPSSYNRGWPVTAEMKAAAGEYRIKNSVDCRGYENMLRFLQDGQGYLYHGSIWTKYMDGPGDKIHQFRGPRRGDQHGGGHSCWFPGWSEICCPCCDWPYLILWNSWGTGWGNDGAKYICKNAIDQMCEDSQTVISGVSDLVKSFGPRQITLRPNDWII